MCNVFWCIYKYYMHTLSISHNIVAHLTWSKSVEMFPPVNKPGLVIYWCHGEPMLLGSNPAENCIICHLTPLRFLLTVLLSLCRWMSFFTLYRPLGLWIQIQSYWQEYPLGLYCGIFLHIGREGTCTCNMKIRRCITSSCCFVLKHNIQNNTHRLNKNIFVWSHHL